MKGEVWQRLTGSLWFIPTLMVFGAIALAIGMVEISSLASSEAMGRFPRLFGAGADGARSMLATIAGSMVTVAGVSFSVTVVAVAQASSQYTPRILRDFMRDRANQSVLGVLMGAFTYCVVVLRTIRGGDNEFIPSIAVLGGVVLAIVAIGVFVFFIHHITETLEAGSILSRITKDTTEAIERYSMRLRTARRTDDGRESAGAAATVPAHRSDLTRSCEVDGTWTPIPADRSGYLQHVDFDSLRRYAREHQRCVSVDTYIGEFVIEGSPWISVRGDTPNDAERDVLNGALQVNSFRTVSQDPGFGIRQIVDIAVKALSPGINDTTTAISCADHLAVILSVIVREEPEWDDDARDAQSSVLMRRHDFASLLGDAMHEIRQSAPENVRVLVRLLHVLRMLEARTTTDAQRRALRHHAELIERTARRAVPDEDRALVLGAYRETMQQLAKR